MAAAAAATQVHNNIRQDENVMRDEAEKQTLLTNYSSTSSLPESFRWQAHSSTCISIWLICRAVFQK